MTWLRPVLYRSSTPSVPFLLKGLIFIGLCLWYSMLIQGPEMCFDPLRIGWQCGLWPRSEEEGPEWQGSCRGTVWSSVARAVEGARQSKRLEQITALLFNYSQLDNLSAVCFYSPGLSLHGLTGTLTWNHIKSPHDKRKEGLFAAFLFDFQRDLEFISITFDSL